MIRQLCPHCQKLVELPDSAAGATADCPLCSKLIVVPAAYSPSVSTGGGLTASPVPPVPPPAPPAEDLPPPPPGLKPPSPPVPPQPEVIPPTVGIPTGYGRVLSLTFAPTWLTWVPVGAVTLALVLTLFTWAGTFPAGIRVYTQNPWWAVFGEMVTNPVQDELLKDEVEINKLLTGNRWLLGYLPLLLIGTFLLWVERLVHNPTVASLPGPLSWLPDFWPRRLSWLTILTGLLFVFLVFQGLRGFGLETALREYVNAKYAKQVEDAATSNSTLEKQKAAVLVSKEFASYLYQTTTAFRLAVLAHLAAFVAMLLRWWLQRRGAKPYPRLLMQW